MAELSKAESLANSIASIEKAFGKGAIMKMNERPKHAFEVISTGAITLDVALGIGGLPRGRIIEIYGPESCGKCLTSDTFVSGPMGLMTIAEIFESQNNPVSCTNRTIEAKVQLQNRYGQAEETTHFTHNNRRATWALKTRSGSSIRCTANHPHLQMNERGHLVWNETKNLKKGDFLSFARTTMSGNTKRDLTEMYLLGLLTADGNIYNNKIAVTNDDPDVKRFIENEAVELVGIGVKQYENNNKGSLNYNFNSKEAVTAFCEKTGAIAGQTAGNKTIPLYVRAADIESVKAFLQGYMDSESSCDENGIEVTSKSFELLQTIKILLTQFGVHGRISSKKVAAYPDEKYWRMSINGNAARLYAEKIGSRSEKVKKNLEKINPGLTGSTNVDSIPNQGWILRDIYDSSETNHDINDIFCDYMAPNPRAMLTYERLQQILDSGIINQGSLLEHLKDLQKNNYVYDEIIDIIENEPEPTFDFAMSKTASFVANGMITHNTTLALHVLAEAQKLGGNAAFIDVEHALDPSYAASLGVDHDNLLVSQPSCGEEALEIADMLIRSNAVDVIVLDSVSALVTRAELEGDMGAANVGVQARLMSQAMRKITSGISRSNCIVIFINQLREKIGVMFGSPETTSGGRALKFYASVRLDVRKTEQIKIGTDVVGNRTKVKVVKNKLAPPFKNAEYDLVFGEGISKIGCVLDLGLEKGVVSKAGAWWTYGDTRIGHGREGAKIFMKENPAIFDEVDQKLRALVMPSKDLPILKEVIVPGIQGNKAEAALAAILG